jgi:hypothetical protein
VNLSDEAQNAGPETSAPYNCLCVFKERWKKVAGERGREGEAHKGSGKSETKKIRINGAIVNRNSQRKPNYCYWLIHKIKNKKCIVTNKNSAGIYSSLLSPLVPSGDNALLYE